MEKHIYPVGESFIDHGRADCACKPDRQTIRKRVATGRFAKSQGYKSEVIYVHNPLKVQA